MRRWTAASLLFVAALAGCRSADKKGDDGPFGPDRPASDLTARGKDKDRDASWLDGPSADWVKGSPAPPAATWAHPNDPGYDLKANQGGTLAGYVEDPDGRKAANVTVTVRENGQPEDKAKVVVTLKDGAFMIQGLPPNKTYVLTVRAAADGRKLFGQVFAKTPNVHIRLPLLDGELPGGEPTAITTPAPALGAPTPPVVPQDADPLRRPPTNAIPRTGPLPAPSFDSSRNLPAPLPLDRESEVQPAGGSDQYRDTGRPGAPAFESPTDRPPSADRFDLMTDKGAPAWKPPVANIPRASTTPRSSGGSGRSESNRPAKADAFTLVDSLGRDRAFPLAGPVLVDFMTTTCIPCQRAAPAVSAVNERYGARGLEVIGLVCDDEPLKTRLAAAEQYRTDHAPNYRLYTEPEKRPGALLHRFGVTSYPTCVLLSPDGKVLWQGHPSDTAAMTSAVEGALRANGK